LDLSFLQPSDNSMAYPWRLFFVSFTLYFLVQGGVEAIRNDPIFTGTESWLIRCLRSPRDCPHGDIPPSPTSYAPVQPPLVYSYPAPIAPIGAPPPSENWLIRCLWSPRDCPHGDIPPSPTSYAPVQPPLVYSYPAPIAPVGAPPSSENWLIRCLRSPRNCPHGDIPPPHPPASSPTS
jgi:hypothetical protein